MKVLDRALYIFLIPLFAACASTPHPNLSEPSFQIGAEAKNNPEMEKYSVQLAEAINPIWKKNLVNRKEQFPKGWKNKHNATAVIIIRIGKDGSLIDAATRAEGTNSPFASQVAIDSIKAAAPFPPPPSTISEQVFQGLDWKFVLDL